MDKRTHNSCIGCDSKSLKSLKRYNASSLVKCENCSLIFSKKIPSALELKEHYQEYGRNDYLSPITIKRYNEILDKFEKYRKTGNLLDVGCGIGYFLVEAKKRGWNVYGTEFTQSAIDICNNKGIETNIGILNPNNYNNVEFDVVTSFEVIEHINNPNEDLQNIYSILRKGGLFYITTPNFNSLNRFYLKENWNVIEYPEHLAYYTKKTLKNLMQKNGFKTISNKSTGISITRIKTSKNKSVENSENISANTDDEKLRNKIEKNSILKFIKTITNSLLNLFGVGDSLKQYNIKS